MGVPVPIWQNMILALRARASSLEKLFWTSRAQLMYQVQGTTRLHNELERLNSLVERLGGGVAHEPPVSSLAPEMAAAPMTPPPTPIKMTREITPMVDGEIQGPPPLQHVYSYDNPLNGFDT